MPEHPQKFPAEGAWCLSGTLRRMSQPTVVVVDDAPEVRALLRTSLRVSGSFVVVGEGGDGHAAVELAEAHQPALLLLDVSMPRLDGLQALPKVLAVSPRTRVVMHTGFDEQGLADRALALGAAGFVEKSAPPSQLERTLTDVLRIASGPVDGGAPSAVPEAPTAPAGSAPAHREPAVDDAAPDGVGAGERGDRRVLAEHLERFREVFQEAAIGLGTMTLTGQLVRGNRALAQLLGRTPEELVGTPYADFTIGGEEHVRSALLEIERAGADVVQVEHVVSGDPTGRRIAVTLAPVRDARRRPLYVFLQAQDVTAQRAAEEGLRQSEERFRLLVETVRDYAIFMLDPQGHVVSWNAGAERSKGYAAHEIIGRHFRTFYPPELQQAQHPEHELELALRDGRYEEEGWRIRKDGTRFWANVVITAVHDASGRHVGFAKVTRDTTERRRMLQAQQAAADALTHANEDLDRANARLQRAADEQADFLAVTAHELRTPVGVVAGSAETLSRHWAELTPDERQEMLEAMASSSNRLRRLLSDLLTVSRLERRALELNLERVEVSRLLATAASAARSNHQGAAVVVHDDEDVLVDVDADRIAQAVDNLVGNALAHGSGTVHLSAEVVGRRVRVVVRDEGGGVQPDQRERLFTRFASGSAGGTGLGLYIVRELAVAHGGEASYEAGTPDAPAGQFVITLPLPVDAP